jgi:alpha-L-rhamnosidase
MFGDISAWFYSTLGGIKPPCESATLTIKPEMPGDLTWVHSRYESVRGPIVSNWKRTGTKLQMEISIPPNSTANVYIPAKNIETISESGKPLNQAANIRVVDKLIDGRACVSIPSGNYVFEAAP